MLFSKQEVEKQYSFLKSSTSYDIRNKANLYLIEFQVTKTIILEKY
jgi:hypothetical protein